MKEFDINTKVTAYEYEELPSEYRELVDIAKEMTHNAYNPYSKFGVGAALKMGNGEVVRGCNQENAAYPSGLCAERSAMFWASANYPDVPMQAIAVAAYTEGHYTEHPVSPCGSCRQVMVEYEDKFKQPLKVILYGTKATYVIEKASSLLPFSFVGDSLKGE